jgi:hypothetical protein
VGIQKTSSDISITITDDKNVAGGVAQVFKLKYCHPPPKKTNGKNEDGVGWEGGKALWLTVRQILPAGISG